MTPSERAVTIAVWAAIIAAFLGYWAWILFIEQPW